MPRALILSIILYHQVLLIHITQAGTLLNVKKRVSSTECCLAWFVLVQKYQYQFIQAHCCISFLKNRASIENRSCLAWQKEKVTPTRRFELRSPAVITGVLTTILDGRQYLLLNNAFLYIGQGYLLRWRFGLRRVSDTKFVGMWTHAWQALFWAYIVAGLRSADAINLFRVQCFKQLVVRIC